MPSKAKKAPGPWADLQPDALEAIACLLSQQDRFKLPLVCSSWREALASAGGAWAAVLVDPRKKTSTSRRVRFNKHLPTADALSAWFGRYGRHVRQLHLRHLDAAAQREGCAAAADVAALLRAVRGGLRQLRLQRCAAGGLLGQHAAEMRGLSRLTSLHLQLPPGEELSLDHQAAEFITCLANLQDLALASGYSGRAHRLPDTLSALTGLRSLQLARLPGPGEPSGAFNAEGNQYYQMYVSACLTGLTALESLALSSFYLVCDELLARIYVNQILNVPPPAPWFPRGIPGLPRLARLHISDCGLGCAPAPPRTHPLLGLGVYPLPEGMAQLAAGLRELTLLEHTCCADELRVLSALTALTALRLASKHRRVAASPLPDALSCLTGLAHLRISHGLTQVPPCITALASLTFLDLSYNQLHSLKPGPYLKRLVAVNLRANAFAHFPKQLRVARHTAQELQLPQNDSMAITERDVEQLLTFERLRQLTIFGASEDKATRRCLALLQKSMPWLLIDV